MSKQPVSIHITHDGNHQLEIQCAGNPFGILYCLARAAAKNHQAQRLHRRQGRRSIGILTPDAGIFDGGGSKQ